jgi:hypothetical protein
LTLILPSEKTDHALCDTVHVKKQPTRRENVIVKGLIVRGDDAELLSRALC